MNQDKANNDGEDQKKSSSTRLLSLSDSGEHSLPSASILLFRVLLSKTKRNDCFKLFLLQESATALINDTFLVAAFYSDVIKQVQEETRSAMQKLKVRHFL